MPKRQSVRERFDKFVPASAPEDCWEWQSVRNRRGYGKFWLNGKTDLAHRVSYALTRGPIPPGLLVRHTCDNPPCVNPSHLLLGTGKDNSQDAIERGRLCRGRANGKAKLTETDIWAIRQRSAEGETQVSLARSFGVSRAAVQWILKGKNWAWLGDAA